MNDNKKINACPCDTCPNSDLCDGSEFGPFACIHWTVWDDQQKKEGN